MNRIFDNPNQLPLKVLERRFAPQDDSAEFKPYAYEIIDINTGIPTGEIHYYIELVSVLDAEVVEGLLTSPITPEEQAYVNEFNADRVQFRQQYQETRDQLQAIEDLTNPTNAQVIQAVKYLAKTLRQVLRLLVKTRFTH